MGGPSSKSELPLIVRQHDWFNIVTILALNLLNGRYIVYGIGFGSFWHCTLA